MANGKYVFGPVPSRRLKRSLGIDLVPFKTCTYDCIYCQLGRTTHKVINREEYTPIEEIISDLQEKLPLNPDYITFSGSGEPTLHSQIGKLIHEIKKLTEIPVAVLTNGSLLWMQEVRDSLQEADLVIPSLDAGNETLFKYINRPHKQLCFDTVVEGLKQFRREYRGEYWLEVFILGGVTGIEAEIKKISAITNDIDPDRIQLNTVKRPPAEEFAFPISSKRMSEFLQIFGDKAEVIAESNESVHEAPEFIAKQQDVLGILNRRPCTIDELVSGLGLHKNEAFKYLQELLEKGHISFERIKNKLYFMAIR